MSDRDTHKERAQVKSSAKDLDQRWFVLGGVVLGYMFFWHSVDGFVRAIDHFGLLFGDFANHFYPEGKVIFSSGEPVTAFFYSAFSAILFGVIALLPLDKAELVWGLLQLAGLAGLYVLPLKEFPAATQRQKSIYTFLFLTSVPILHNFKWGQISVFLTLGMFSALYYYRKDKKLLSASILAFTVSVKYYPVILLVYFVFRRDVRYVVTALGITFLFSVVIPVLVLGYHNTLHFSMSVLAASARSATQWIARDSNSQAFPHVLGRLFGLNQEFGANPFLLGGGFALAAVGLFVPLHSFWRNPKADAVLGPTLLLALTPFLAPTSWSHYFVFLPALYLYTMSGAFSHTSDTSAKNPLMAVLWTGSAALSNTGLLLAAGGWVNYIWYGPMLWASILMLVLGMLQLASGQVKDGNVVQT